MALEDGGYIFGGSTGLSYEQLKQRRAIAQALATRNQGFPKNKGEGMTYLGQSIAEALGDIGLQRREAEYRKGLQGAAAKIAPVMTPPQMAPRVSEAPPPVAPPPPPIAEAPPVAPPVPVADTPVDTSPGAMAGYDPDVAPSPPAMAGAPAVPPPPMPPMPPMPPTPAVSPVSVDPNAAAPLTGGNTAGPQDLSMVPPVRDRIAAAMQIQPAAPVSTPDVPLPRGDPRTTGGVRATMEAALSRGGQSPTAIAGIERNVRDESGFNPNLRHPDQPKFGGEAHFAHGLYQEGGDEWNNYVKWIDKNAPGSDWRDPNLQSKFLAERLQDPQYANANAGMNAIGATPGQSANAFLRGYLKPAAGPMAQRSAQYLREGGGGEYSDKQLAQDGSVSPAAPGPRLAAGGGREGGEPVDDTRDLVTQALLDQPQQKPQEQQSQDLLPDVAGMSNRTVLPQRPTASLGRTGVASDTSLPGLAPMGALTGAPGPAVPPPAMPAQDPREAITQALLSQPGPGATDLGANAGAIQSPTAAAAAPPPPTMTDIQPAPIGGAPGTQTAQAVPQYVMPPGPPLTTGTRPTPPQFQKTLTEPPPPVFTQPTQAEINAHAFKRQYIDNPQAGAYADDIIKTEQARRAQQDMVIQKKWEQDNAAYKDQLIKEQDYQRATPQREQEFREKQQNIIGGAPGAPGAPQPALGSPQSPQRSGIPTVPPRPDGVTPAKWAELQAPVQVAAVEAVQKATPQFDDAIKAIQMARTHPGREYGLSPVGGVARHVPYTDAYAFQKINDQMTGKTFLTAYNTLKGGGQISNVEGEKAQTAQARIDPSQKPKDYDAALNDLETQLRRDQETAQRKVNQPVTAWRGPGDNSSYAPDIGERKGNHEYIGGNPRDPASWRKIQ